MMKLRFVLLLLFSITIFADEKNCISINKAKGLGYLFGIANNFLFDEWFINKLPLNSKIIINVSLCDDVYCESIFNEKKEILNDNKIFYLLEIEVIGIRSSYHTYILLDAITGYYLGIYSSLSKRVMNKIYPVCDNYKEEIKVISY